MESEFVREMDRLFKMRVSEEMPLSADYDRTLEQIAMEEYKRQKAQPESVTQAIAEGHLNHQTLLNIAMALMGKKVKKLRRRELSILDELDEAGYTKTHRGRVAIADEYYKETQEIERYDNEEAIDEES